MTDEKLLSEILRNKLLDEAAVTKLKKESLLSGRPVEEIIYNRRIVDDIKLAELKSQVLGVPLQRFKAEEIPEEVLKLIPEETVRTYAVSPLGQDNGVFVVGMVNPDDTKAQEALKFIARRNRLNLGIYLISYGDLQNILRRYSPFKSEIQAAIQSLGLKGDEGARKIVSLEERGKSGIEEAPIIRIVAETLKEAVESEASDVHIEPQENYLRIRFRIDGVLREAANLPAEISSSVVSRVKVISNLKIDETRIPQDGRFRSRIVGREIDFRVATFPTPLGEKVALRILDPSVGLKNFDQIGLVGRNLEIINRGLEKPFGMILVSGPTGSGKSTTLYSLLQKLNSEGVNIVSLEDPVEYFVSGINQSQVRPEIGYDFASGLRQILRQDPDIIMVGEIRDDETAGLAVHAALTGHIVLSTLHTNNAVGVVPRLIDMKVEPFLLPSALNLMVSQRLVSMLCQNCRAKTDPSAPILKAIQTALKNLPPELSSKYKEPIKIYKSSGCEKCQNRGFVGRSVIMEVLEMTPELETIINSSPTSDKIMTEARRQKMVTLRQDGVMKALDGLISIEEVLRETEEY